MEFYLFFPLSPSLTVVFAKHQIIAPIQRHGIDEIIELTFSARLDRHCEFR
jgi:hypothetical protein